MFVKLTKLKHLCTVLLPLLLLLSGSLFGQENAVETLRIEQIDFQNYPNLKVYAATEDFRGEPISTLVRGNFLTRVDAEPPIDDLKVDSFLFTDEPVYYSLLISVSGRMTSALYYQKEAVLALLDQMKDNDRISLYTVGAEAVPVFQRLKKDEVDVELVRGLEVGEDVPNILDSLTGLVMQTQNEEVEDIDRKVIVAFSDGRDANSRFDRETLLKRSTDLGVPIYSIGISVFGDNLDFLNNVSNQTGGSYQFVRANNYAGLPALAERVVTQVSQSYVLNFTVQGVPADDEYHQLMLQVNKSDKELVTYRNFIAVKVPFPLWLQIVILASVLILVAGGIVFLWFFQQSQRKALGISDRRCPDCGRRMKDDWIFAPFAAI
jgi:hypothetical protein